MIYIYLLTIFSLNSLSLYLSDRQNMKWRSGLMRNFCQYVEGSYTDTENEILFFNIIQNLLFSSFQYSYHPPDSYIIHQFQLLFIDHHRCITYPIPDWCTPIPYEFIFLLDFNFTSLNSGSHLHPKFITNSIQNEILTQLNPRIFLAVYQFHNNSS